MSEERLISKSKGHSGQEMPDKLYDLMLNIEETFIMAGARPKHDYVYRDLMDYAVELFDPEEYEDLKMLTAESD